MSRVVLLARRETVEGFLDLLGSVGGETTKPNLVEWDNFLESGQQFGAKVKKRSEQLFDISLLGRSKD